MTKRTIPLGLMGMILTVGVAEAKVCRLDGLELVAVADREPPDASFKGAKFRVIRQASQFKPAFKGYWMTRSHITIEVVGTAGRFVVVQDYEPTGSPWVTASSRPAADKSIQVNWAGRDTAQEAKLFAPDPSFGIYTSPLAGYSLMATNCGPGGKRGS